MLEATLCVALENQFATGGPKVFLTRVSCFGFGNSKAWITESITRALNRHPVGGLDFSFVRQVLPMRA